MIQLIDTSNLSRLISDTKKEGSVSVQEVLDRLQNENPEHDIRELLDNAGVLGKNNTVNYFLIEQKIVDGLTDWTGYYPEPEDYPLTKLYFINDGITSIENILKYLINKKLNN